MKVKDLKKAIEGYDDDDEVVIEGEDEELYECYCEDAMLMVARQNLRVLMIAKS